MHHGDTIFDRLNLYLVDVNFVVGRQLMSVHEAVKNGDVLELENMVKRGASINEVDNKDKFTPLHWAAHRGAIEVSLPFSLSLSLY